MPWGSGCPLQRVVLSLFWWISDRLVRLNTQKLLAYLDQQSTEQLDSASSSNHLAKDPDEGESPRAFLFFIFYSPICVNHLTRKCASGFK